MLPFGPWERCASAVLGLVLGLVAVGLGWIDTNFPLKGGGWFDLIAGLVIKEFITALGLGALVLLLGAAFTPARLSPRLTATWRHAIWTIQGIGCLLAAVALLVPLAGAVLAVLGFLD